MKGIRDRVLQQETLIRLRIFDDNTIHSYLTPISPLMPSRFNMAILRCLQVDHYPAALKNTEKYEDEFSLTITLNIRPVPTSKPAPAK